MEDFLKIDWNPPTSDVVDDVFINEDRLKSTSVMYQLIREMLVDPTKDAYKKYIDKITPDDIKIYKAMMAKQNVEKNLKRRKKEADNSVEQEMELPRGYVPGVPKKLDIRFPRSSSLTAEQQALGVIEARYFRDKNSQLFLGDLDSNFENLAKEHNVDLVITQSGLNCLAINIDPSYANNWILPVEVKEINNKNVVFVGKPLPPMVKNVLQKNSWVAKYILKSFFLVPDSPDANTQDNLLRSRPPNWRDPDISVEDSDRVWCEQYQYNIYEIGSGGSPQNELMKSKIQKDYKLLVRTKIDGIEKSRNDETNRIKLAPKLENQLYLGAEAVTIEEGARQWISLAFTPDTTLLRVRMSAQTLEYIQRETRSTVSISNELNRLHNVKGEDAYPIIYNVADTMTKMPPGRYLLRHTPRNGAFANIYKETDQQGKNTIDLEVIFCQNEFETASNPPWPLIDNKALTPALIHWKRLPAMFYPSKFPPKPQQKKNLRNRNTKK
ncbi:Similar to ICE2: Little elongation complex subunit 2 (Bos taurus) [Cotesia congregata]|uniref:Similar to ICE2: Little elongation complex subunit 2 (Bos taurus) n=1 Tax=Cotesia congregata TaxID=51543 RepID=A0A8J2EDQ1_COTCN|nr:Similar to ICE2: Little elongation complex subunit 2 (Bos taurus) [Cotesia congregata]